MGNKCVLCRRPVPYGKISSFCSKACEIAHLNKIKFEEEELAEIVFKAKKEQQKNMGENIVLAIPDTHAPFVHKNALDFLNDVAKEFKPNIIVHLGDEVDFHAMSKYDSDPDGLSPGDELKQAKEWLKQIYKLFPDVLVCESNHTARPFKKAYSSGIPIGFMKQYREFLEAPTGWEWRDKHIIDQVQYLHGEGFTGNMGHMKAALGHMTSTVIGHIHAHAGLQYRTTAFGQIFGMNCGWLGDAEKYAFAYGKHFTQKPTLGCGIIYEGNAPAFIPMER